MLTLCCLNTPEMLLLANVPVKSIFSFSILKSNRAENELIGESPDGNYRRGKTAGLAKALRPEVVGRTRHLHPWFLTRWLLDGRLLRIQEE
jgi:hypothetical protein